MKKTRKARVDELRPEYDLGDMGPGVRGKHARALAGSVRRVSLDADVAAAFPTDEAVNQALRALLAVAKGIHKPRRAARK